MKISDTPRCDMESVSRYNERGEYMGQCVMINVAKTLEREVNYWRNELMMLKERLREK